MYVYVCFVETRNAFTVCKIEKCIYSTNQFSLLRFALVSEAGKKNTQVDLQVFISLVCVIERYISGTNISNSIVEVVDI